MINFLTTANGFIPSCIELKTDRLVEGLFGVLLYCLLNGTAKNLPGEGRFPLTYHS